jgi:hypothetical protein
LTVPNSINQARLVDDEYANHSAPPLFHLVMQGYGCLIIIPNPNVSHFVSLFCIGIYGQCDPWRDKMDSGGKCLPIFTGRMITHGEGKSKSLIHT